ncbi:MAG: hypothetical protein U0R52_10820 [Solirubrobacterales bacterium]
MASSKGKRFTVAAVAAAALLVPAFASGTASAKSKGKVLTVCKHGCKYRTIQAAVDASGRGATVRVKPGKYVEGVQVSGSRHDGLKIIGTGRKPGAVVLDGKNAKLRDGSLANNGVEGIGVDRLTVANMKVMRYAANGVYTHGSSDNKATACHGYTMRNMVAAFNRSYGLFAFNCIGGRMTDSVGYGQGDSAYYVGGTPFQSKPKWTSLDHLTGFRNVLGFSGTNSKYVNIHDNDFFNNGAGIVPNTLDSEPYEPTTGGVIQDNNIFWNNFNYYLPASNVKTVSGGLGTVGTLELNYPIGAGVIVFGGDGWTVKNNRIFGNYQWGAAAFSDPFNTGDDATSRNNRFIDNKMGRNGTDKNGTAVYGADFWVDGSGSGNCFSGNGAAATFDPSSVNTLAFLYPSCPAPGSSGTGTSIGDTDQQFGDLINYVGSDNTNPADGPEQMECGWTQHSHPAFKGYKPLKITPGPVCLP